MSQNIVLIGFMGVGKGRTARELARKSGWYAVDCDDLIESFANLRVKKIFAQSGEKEFRQMERQVALWLEKQVRSTIISTGGGFFKVPNIKKIGRIVYLHSEFQPIIDRIKAHPNAARKIKKRPLLQDLGKAEKLYNERLLQYRKIADIEVNVQGRETDKIVEKILKKAAMKKY